MLWVSPRYTELVPQGKLSNTGTRTVIGVANSCLDLLQVSLLTTLCSQQN